MDTSSPQSLNAFQSFEDASKAILDLLYQHLPLGLWMITRTESKNWIVLSSNSPAYNVKPGNVFNWSDSFCSRMVRGEGPRFAPDAQAIPVYAAAPVNKALKIGAYVGIPLVGEADRFFGTLCGVDPSQQSEQITKLQPFVEMIAQLLSTVLSLEQSNINLQRVAFRMTMEGERCPHSMAYLPTAWDDTIDFEERIADRFGEPMAFVVAKATGGDSRLKDLATRFTSRASGSDFVAITGADEVSLLIAGGDSESIQQRIDGIRGEAEQTGEFRIGAEMRHPGLGLRIAYRQAKNQLGPATITPAA